MPCCCTTGRAHIDLLPEHETPRARWGDVRAGGRSPRPSGDVCAEPLSLEGSPET